MVRYSVIRCNFVEENCYILWEDGLRESCWLVDCGAWGPSDQQKIADYLLKEGLKVTRHLLTHGHFDHVMGCQWVYDRYGVGPTLLKEELDTYNNSCTHMRACFGVDLGFSVPPVVHTLCEGEEIMLGSARFQVLSTPGHTPGGCCYYCATEDLLLSGDTLFRRGVGRTDLPGGNGTQLYASLNKLLGLPESTIVLPGHGPATSIGEEKFLV